jgi:hypothetical protein
MAAEMIAETSVIFNQLIWLIAVEDFIYYTYKLRKANYTDRTYYIL